MDITISQQIAAPNFNGKLTKEGVKLGNREFRRVAKLYNKASGNLPDLKLRGVREKRENGTIIHLVDVCTNEGEVYVDTFVAENGEFKRFFEKDPQEVVNDLINIAKRYFYDIKSHEINVPVKNIESRVEAQKEKIMFLEEKAQKLRASGYDKIAAMWDGVVKSMRGKLERLNEELCNAQKIAEKEKRTIAYLKDGEIVPCFEM